MVTSFCNLEIEICELSIQRFIVGFLFASDIVQQINNTKPKRAKKNSMIGSISLK
jgi:restriction endonuclease S subunit